MEVVGPAPDGGVDRSGGETAAAARAAGATMAAMTDRVAAFGGALTVIESEGRRTVRAWLPLDREGLAA